MRESCRRSDQLFAESLIRKGLEGQKCAQSTYDDLMR
jgi:hypothetical protein